ncbi:MAG: GNAT family N-acetyltransferase [Chloroflexi bacterium]|nr:GNAT family N-acetyltransferase [Chloroflexota bacterium]
MMDVIIRAAETSDMDAIARMWMELVDHHQLLDPRLPPAAKDGARRYAVRLEERLDDPTTRVLIAEADGKVAGYILAMIVDMLSDLFMQETTGFVADIYVRPELRGLGIGRALVESLQDWFRESGVRYYEWHVASENAEGKAFWESLGGKPVLVRMRHEIDEA